MNTDNNEKNMHKKSMRIQPQTPSSPHHSTKNANTSTSAPAPASKKVEGVESRVKRSLTPEQKKRIIAERKRKAEIWQANEFMAFILCIAMVGILTIVGIIAVVAPKSGYSSLEKRKLAEMPKLSAESLADGSFSDGVDLFFADNFPWRESFISQSKSLRKLFGIRPEGKTLYQSDDGNADDENANLGLSTDAGEIDRILNEIKGNPSSNSEENSSQNNLNEDNKNTEQNAENDVNKDVSAPQTGAANGSVNNADVTGEKRGALYVIGDTALELYSGKKEQVEYYAQVVNLHAETYKKLSAQINVYCMVFPTHTEFALPQKERNLSNEQRPIINALEESLSENVTFVDPYESLKNAYERGEYVYFRTDHHWTARGAYYAFEKFAEAASLTHKNLKDYSNGKISEFLGSFYASTTDPALKSNPDYVEYFNIDTPYKATYYNRDKTVYRDDETLLYRGISDINNGYLCFTGGDQPYIKIVTENKNGRKLLIFKESYGNPLVTFLTDCYEEIHVADIRTFPYNSAVFVSENGITDVLFTNSVMSASTANRINDIEKLLTKN